MKKAMHAMESAEQYCDHLQNNDAEHDLLIEARELLDWVARCAYANGPVGTKMYFISDDKMQQIRELRKELK